MTKAQVLIVEDDLIVAEDMQNRLENLGFDVSGRVSSGKEAIDIIRDKNPDLVLMDIVLYGEMDGIETAQIIRTEFNIPVIYLTAYAHEEVLERAKITEPYGYIIKPFQDRELASVIEIALYKHKMENKLRVQNQIANIFLTKNDEEMYGEVLDLVLDIMKSEFGVFGYIDDEGALVCPSMTKDIWDQCQIADKVLVFPENTWGDSIWGKGLRTKKSAYSNKSFNVPEGHISISRCLTVPIVFHNTSIGNLLVANKTTNYLDSDKQILESIAVHIAPVLYARLKVNSSEKAKEKLEERLLQSQKMETIGTLAGGIAHDFNNILFPIVGFTEMMLDDAPEESDLRNSLNEVLTASLRAKDLVQQILTFSRQAEKELKPLKIHMIIREVLKLMRASLPTTISLEQDIDKNCGMVLADPTHIQQIGMNLITNAYHSMEEDGGTLRVTLSEVNITVEDLTDFNLDPGRFIRFSVSDTGHGIEKHILNRIFEPYFTTKNKDKGTGLGLSVVHGIIKSYKGDIRVHSEPGKGTVFNVYLPIIQSKKEVTHIEDHFSIQGGNEHILLIDDEEQILKMEKQMLERLGYHVTTRASSSEALEAFRSLSHKFDLVITDMTMPNMTGEKLALELKNIRKEIPVILCTGFSEKISKEKADALGIDGFLMKPVVKSELTRKIRTALDSKKEG